MANCEQKICEHIFIWLFNRGCGLRVITSQRHESHSLSLITWANSANRSVIPAVVCVIFWKKKIHIGHCVALCAPVCRCTPLCVLFIYFDSNEEGRHRRASCSVNLANNYFHGRSVRRSNRCTPYSFLSALVYFGIPTLFVAGVSRLFRHTHALFSAAFHTSIGTLHNPQNREKNWINMLCGIPSNRYLLRPLIAMYSSRRITTSYTKSTSAPIAPNRISFFPD